MQPPPSHNDSGLIDAAAVDTLIAGLQFTAEGLIPAIAQDAASREVLMMAWMNAESIRATFATGRVHYWSRSRGALWCKGETSGHVQTLIALRVDCDADALLLDVEQEGPACHTNRRSCFYRLMTADGLAVTAAPLEPSSGMPNR